MSLDRVREAWSFTSTWVREPHPSGTWQDRVNLIESALTTHEKEDEERERREEELDSLLADERENSKELATQLQELLEAAKARKHYSDNPRTTLHSWNDHELLDDIGGVCGQCQVIQNIEKGG